MKSVKQIVAAVMLMLGCGCIFSGGNTVPEIFDPVPDSAVCNLPVNRLRVSNESGADRRFLYRGKNNRMIFDEYRLWILDPELLLKRALKSTFVKHSRNTCDITCTIDRFEFDLVNNCAVLKLAVDISRGAVQHSFVCSEKATLASGSSSDASAAAAKCITSAMAKICAEYTKFSGKGNK